MKWVTRSKVKVDRVACPWLINRFIDGDAKFLFVAADEVLPTAQKENAIPYDVPDAELGHHDGKCSFEAIIAKYGLADPALELLAQIVHGADCKDDQYKREEASGLLAIATGFSLMGIADHEVLKLEFSVYDALYLYCQHKLKGE
jgi:hypothetical protein